MFPPKRMAQNALSHLMRSVGPKSIWQHEDKPDDEESISNLLSTLLASKTKKNSRIEEILRNAPNVREEVKKGHLILSELSNGSIVYLDTVQGILEKERRMPGHFADADPQYNITGYRPDLSDNDPNNIAWAEKMATARNKNVIRSMSQNQGSGVSIDATDYRRIQASASRPHPTVGG